MADRTAVDIFGYVFKALARHRKSEEVQAIARMVWYKSGLYDFDSSQMDADAALVSLGLARRVRGDIEYGPAEDE